MLVDNQEVFKEAYSIAELIIPDQKEKVRFYDEEIPIQQIPNRKIKLNCALSKEISLFQRVNNNRPDRNFGDYH